MLEVCDRWLWNDSEDAVVFGEHIDGMNAIVQRIRGRVNRLGRQHYAEVNVVKLLLRLGHELRLDLRPLLLEVSTRILDFRERCGLLTDGSGVDVLRDLDNLEAAAAVLESRLHARFNADGMLAGQGTKIPHHLESTEPLASSLEGHVLLVDDQPIVQAVVGGKLRALGLRVSAVASGEAALDALQGGDIDTILLDLILPGMSGLDVLRAVAANRELRGVPVIVLTGVSDPAEVARCIELGAADVLDKNHHPSLLRARVENCIARKRARDREVAWYWEAVAQRKRSDALLRTILPRSVVKELKETGRTRAREHDFVAVLFCDISGFTKFCTENDADTIRDALQEITELYEELCGVFHLEKIKTIGDSFMAVAGLQDGTERSCEAAVRCGLEMVAVAPTLSARWHVRVAIHAGPVIAGVVGRQKYQYDLWGDTVNTAARIEGLAAVDELWISEVVLSKLGPEWPVEPVGTFDVRGKGSMRLHRVTGRPECEQTQPIPQGERSAFQHR